MGAAVNDVFRAIADPTRRQILLNLGQGPQSVGEICGQFPISQPTISAHLEVLREVGLVSARRQGQQRIYSIEAAPLAEVADWLKQLEDFWRGGLERLGRALDEDAGPRPSVRRRRK